MTREPTTTELPDLTAAEAREITDCIVEHVLAAAGDIATAHQRRADRALGYASWEAYCDAEFGRLALSREQRSEMVGALRAQGMSLRAIGAATGVDKHTVGRELSAGGAFAPPDKVTGLDGKGYRAERPRPAPQVVEPEPERPRQRPVLVPDVVEWEPLPAEVVERHAERAAENEQRRKLDMEKLDTVETTIEALRNLAAYGLAVPLLLQPSEVKWTAEHLDNAQRGLDRLYEHLGVTK